MTVGDSELLTSMEKAGFVNRIFFPLSMDVLHVVLPQLRRVSLAHPYATNSIDKRISNSALLQAILAIAPTHEKFCVHCIQVRCNAILLCELSLHWAGFV